MEAKKLHYGLCTDILNPMHIISFEVPSKYLNYLGGIFFALCILAQLFYHALKLNNINNSENTIFKIIFSAFRTCKNIKFCHEV